MQEGVKLLSNPSNFAVVQLPNRSYPGVVVQGDTLQGFIAELAEMKKLLEEDNGLELASAIDFMKSRLEEARSHYEVICAQNGIDLPYVKGGF